MHAELYTDGIDEITVSGTVVRVDLVSLSPTERDANNAPKKVFRQRLIFSVEAFANSVEVMQKALQGLVDAGVIKQGQPRAVIGRPSAQSGEGGPRQRSQTNRDPECLNKFPLRLGRGFRSAEYSDAFILAATDGTPVSCERRRSSRR